MKIFVLGINFYPEPIGISVYTTEMCEHLTKAGHGVTVFTAFPYYPQWCVLQQYKKRFFVTENYQGITIRRSFLYVPKKVTTASRVLHELSFIISSFFNMLLSGRPDILITVSPPLGLGLVAYIISKIKKVPFIFHIQDLQPDTAAELGMLRNKVFLRLLYVIEKFIYIQATKVCVISKKMGEKVISKGVKQEKVVLFPNWVDAELIKPLPRINKFRDENKLENRFVVLYSGNIGIKEGLNNVLEVAVMTRDNKDIVYAIAGNGVYRKELVRKYEELRLKNVVFLPVQSKEMLPYMLSAADVCLIPQQKSVTDMVMPSKLLAIMSSGKPVVAGANVGSELYSVINNSCCGITVEPENTKQMMDAIMKIYADPERGKDCGRKGREYAVKHFSKEYILKSFEEKIHELIR